MMPGPLTTILMNPPKSCEFSAYRVVCQLVTLPYLAYSALAADAAWGQMAAYKEKTGYDLVSFHPGRRLGSGGGTAAWCLWFVTSSIAWGWWWRWEHRRRDIHDLDIYNTWWVFSWEKGGGGGRRASWGETS